MRQCVRGCHWDREYAPSVRMSVTLRASTKVILECAITKHTSAFSRVQVLTKNHVKTIVACQRGIVRNRYGLPLYFLLAWFSPGAVYNLSSPNATQKLSSPCLVAGARGNLKCVSLRASTTVSLESAHTQAFTSTALVGLKSKNVHACFSSLVRGSTRVDAGAARNTQAQAATRKHTPATRRDGPAERPRQGGNLGTPTKNPVGYTQDTKNSRGYTSAHPPFRGPNPS